MIDSLGFFAQLAIAAGIVSFFVGVLILAGVIHTRAATKAARIGKSGVIADIFGETSNANITDISASTEDIDYRGFMTRTREKAPKQYEFDFSDLAAPARINDYSARNKRRFRGKLRNIRRVR